jgi:hypothetical protein
MQLADNERLVLEAPFGIGAMGGTATLTDRRVVLAARDFEESIPLRAITSVRCAFSRDFAAAAWGALLLALALAFGAGYKTMETAANGVALAIEKRVTEKQPSGEAYGHYVDVSAALIWVLMLPLIGLGAAKLGAGLVGETALTLSTASESVDRASYGRRRELMEFGEEVGRRTGASGL